MFNVSRTTYYKIKEQFIKTGSLEPRMPNETCLSKKKIILKYIQEHPSHGPGRIAYSLRREDIVITKQAVWYNLRRFGLNKKFKRLIYLETLKELEQPLTEKTLRTINDIKHGQWPEHIVALDTFFVGNLKIIKY